LRPAKIFLTIILSTGSGEKLGPNLQGTRTHRVRMTLSCVVFLGLSPILAKAQSNTVETVPSSAESRAKVSVRELQVPRKARDAFKKGTDLLGANQPAASIPEFRRAIKIFPEFYEAHYKIGLANLNLRRYDEAQAAFETSIVASNGRYPPSQFGLGLVLCAKKHYDEAVEAVHAGLDQYPADAAGNFTLAWILFSAGRLAEAEKSAHQAVLTNANLASAYLLLAQIHLRQSDLRAVVSELDAYLRLDPSGVHKAQATALRAQAQQVLAKRREGTDPVLAESPMPEP
jgi:tetratricopeptide (TPR) repeat protein